MSSEVVWELNDTNAIYGNYEAVEVKVAAGHWYIHETGDDDGIHVDGTTADIERILRALNGEPDPRVAELEAKCERLTATVADMASAIGHEGPWAMSASTLRAYVSARDAEVGRLAECVSVQRDWMDKAIEFIDEGDESKAKFMLSPRDDEPPFAALSEPAREQDGGGE